MLPIGKNNIFYGEKYGIVDVLEVYDLEGINWILFHPIHSLMKSLVKNKSVQVDFIHYNCQDEDKLKFSLKNSITSNLFRLDLIVIESNVNILNKIRELTNLPVIFIRSYIDRSVEIQNYDYKYEFKDGFYNSSTLDISNLRNRFLVRNVKDEEFVLLDSLKQSYLRNKKIEDILKF